MPTSTLTWRSVRHPIALRRAVVSTATPVVPSIVRVTLVGPELDGFASLGPADHIKVFFPDPATGHLAVPTFGEQGPQPPDSGTVIVRDYTPRDFRPATGGAQPELDIDFVVHGDEGPASAWAVRALPGAELAVAGPRGSRLVPDGLDRLILVADESAFPATARWLRLAPPEVPATVLLDVADPASARYFDGEPGSGRATFTVVPRAGGDGDPDGGLERALRALGPIGPATAVFLAGEAGRLVPLRRYLRRELGLPREQVTVSGYWRRGVVALDHHAPVDPSDPD